MIAQERKPLWITLGVLLLIVVVTIVILLYSREQIIARQEAANKFQLLLKRIDNISIFYRNDIVHLNDAEFVEVMGAFSQAVDIGSSKLTRPGRAYFVLSMNDNSSGQILFRTVSDSSEDVDIIVYRRTFRLSGISPLIEQILSRLEDP